MAKIRFHWGIGIAVFYVSFVVVLVGFVIFTTFNKVDLVDDNYYDQELKYQGQIEKIKRSQSLIQKLSIVPIDNSVMLVFPGTNNGQVKGEIVFFRPSDKKLDFKVQVSPDSSGNQFIKSSNLQKGLWRIKVDWSDGDSTYFDEKVIVLN